jgi:hypothetical protein
MDLYRIINELVQERARLERIIQSLEGMSPSTSKIPVRAPGKRRGRKSMDSVARKEVSERMKIYWAGRRKEKQKETKQKEPKPKDKHLDAAAGK